MKRQTNRKTSNPELYFKDSEQMSQIFSDIPDIIDNNLFIAKKCNYFPVEISPRLPKFSIDFMEMRILKTKCELICKNYKTIYLIIKEILCLQFLSHKE